jgi:hypothetical protein
MAAARLGVGYGSCKYTDQEWDKAFEHEFDQPNLHRPDAHISPYDADSYAMVMRDTAPDAHKHVFRDREPVISGAEGAASWRGPQCNDACRTTKVQEGAVKATE